MHKKTDHEDRALRLNLKFKPLTFLIYKKRCKAVTHQHNKKLYFLRRSWLYFSLNIAQCYSLLLWRVSSDNSAIILRSQMTRFNLGNL